MTAESAFDKYLRFRVNDKSFALPLVSVAEVFDVEKFEQSEKVPEGFRGVVECRGEKIYAMALDKILGLDVSERPSKEPVIVIMTSVGPIGLAVTEVQKVIEPNGSQIEKADQLPDVAQKYIDGIINLEDEFFVVLNLGAILEHLSSLSSLPSDLAS